MNNSLSWFFIFLLTFNLARPIDRVYMVAARGSAWYPLMRITVVLALVMIFCEAVSDAVLLQSDRASAVLF